MKNKQLGSIETVILTRFKCYACIHAIFILLSEAKIVEKQVQNVYINKQIHCDEQRTCAAWQTGILPYCREFNIFI